MGVGVGMGVGLGKLRAWEWRPQATVVGVGVGLGVEIRDEMPSKGMMGWGLRKTVFSTYLGVLGGVVPQL